LNVFVEGNNEAVGFISITPETTVMKGMFYNTNFFKLSEARKAINEEVEGVPPSWRFLIKNHDVFVKVIISTYLLSFTRYWYL
jgi:hypothetical protein